MALPAPTTNTLFSILFFASVALLAVSSGTGRAHAAAAAEPGKVSREFFPLERDIAVILQVSDLHFSAYHPERSEDLVKSLAPVLRAVRPDLLLLTGDLTDAKTKDRRSTRQDESEWIQYRNAVDALVEQGGIDKRRIFDIRGNHDKYGVPFVNDRLDFFSMYSVSSQLNRSNAIYSVSLLGSKKYQFLGIDDTIDIGIRGPTNLFGHPTAQRVEMVKSELDYWGAQPGEFLTKIVFGHFPMSFTASPEKGERYEDVFARRSVSAYICGHLHATFGRRLWRLHSIGSAHEAPKPLKQFWEWEVGDWKDNRLIRILAIDSGEVSFLDIDLSSKTGAQDKFQTIVFVTYPLDSRSMNGVQTDSSASRKDISALVFATRPIQNVTAKVYDSWKGFVVVEEVTLQLASASFAHEPLFRAEWNAENYRCASASRYWLQVFVLDSEGGEAASTRRPFSVDGKLERISDPWLTFLVFELQWDTLYSVLLWGNVGLLVLLLCIPKLLTYFMGGNASHSVASPSRLKKVTRFFIEGSRNTILWLILVLYFVYLLAMPWFWGRPTSEDGALGNMYLRGWAIKNPKTLLTRGGLATPDIFTITLPFMYLVALPMVLLVYGLFAERSRDFLRSKKVATEHSAEPLLMAEEESVEGGAPAKLGSKASFYRICGGCARKVLLLLSLAVALIHLKLCSSLMAAYGVGAVALSPALTWAPPLLIAAAIYFSTIGIAGGEQVSLA